MVTNIRYVSIVYIMKFVRKNSMKTKKIIFNISLILWLISTVYFLYKYSFGMGYWKNPLLVSVFFYILAIINKGFNKITTFISVYYIGFGVWFLIDLLLSMGNVLLVD